MEILTAIDTGAVYGVFSDFEKVMEARSELNKQGIKEFMHSTIDEGNVLSLDTIEVMKKKPRNTKEYLNLVYHKEDYKVNDIVFVVMENLNEYDVLKGIYNTSTDAKSVAVELCKDDDNGWFACIEVIMVEVGKPFRDGKTIATYERVKGQCVKVKGE